VIATYRRREEKKKIKKNGRRGEEKYVYDTEEIGITGQNPVHIPAWDW